MGINICEYCEIEEDGEKRNLSYYQSRKLSKHLISELGNWREEILRYQNINGNVNVSKIINSLEENKVFLENTKAGLTQCENQITN